MHDSSDHTMILAIRTKSIIKSPQKLIDTSETLNLTKLNQVLLCKNQPSVLGKLKALRNQVAYFVVDPVIQKTEFERIGAYYVKRFKKTLNLDKKINFGVNSPYKQKVQKEDRHNLSLYLNTYFFRTKAKKTVLN